MNSKNIFLTVLLMLFFVGISSAQKGFIKIGDIKGESTERNHKDWIDIESFNQSIQKQIATATGTARRRAAPIFTNVVFTKRLDRATPKLMESCAIGKQYPKVEMEMTADNERGQNQIFYKVTLENVIISGVNSSATCTPNCEVMEEVALSFTKISWEHSDSSGQKVVTTYDIERAR